MKPSDDYALRRANQVFDSRGGRGDPGDVLDEMVLFAAVALVLLYLTC